MSSQLLPQWQIGSATPAGRRAKHLLLVQAAPRNLYAPGRTKATQIKGFLGMLDADRVLFMRLPWSVESEHRNTVPPWCCWDRAKWYPTKTTRSHSAAMLLAGFQFASLLAGPRCDTECV